jgi:uracil-DNA glycosylase
LTAFRERQGEAGPGVRADAAPALDRPDARARLGAAIAACRLCQERGLLARAHPIPPRFVPGARIVLIGQAPGAITDRRGYHFAGPAGTFLDRWFDRAGFPPNAFRERVHLTSLTRCFPGKAPTGHGDRPPSPAERALCRPYLDRELELLEPRLVVLVGKLAIDAFLGARPLRATVGRVHERDGRRYLPLPHASGVSRWLNDPANRALLERALAELARLRVELEL